MIHLVEPKDKKEWDELLLGHNGSFTQSWQWGEMQKREGGKALRFSILRDNNVLGCLSLYVRKTPAGFYGYIPRGPAVGERDLSDKDWSDLLELLHEIAKREDLVFLLFEPVYPGAFGNLRAAENRQPNKTIFIDLLNPLEDLLSRINKTKRYGIRYAENHGVTVRISDKSKTDFEKFWKLLQGTAARKQFGTFSRSHFENIFYEDISKMFLAEYEGHVEAAAEVIFFGDTAIYLHAGTSGKNEKLMASYLLVWEILKKANKTV